MGVQINFVEDLREFDFGSFSGKHKDDVDWNNWPQDSEKKEDVLIRAMRFLDFVYEHYKDKTVLFVAHGGVNLCLISAIKNSDYNASDWSQKNTCVNVFEIKGDGNHKIEILNCVKHLE